MLQRIVSLVNLAITGFYIYSLIMHVIRPGGNAGYTRMLMFACLATIPVAFMLAMIGGQDRWPVLFRGLKELGQTGTTEMAVVVGVIFILVVMPLGMLVGVWFGMGFKFGTLFLLFFVPLLLRLTLTSAKSSTDLAVYQVLLYFGAFFAAIALVRLLGIAQVDLQPYEQNVQTVWPGYGDAAVMFFAVWLLAITQQVMEFRYALISLFDSS
ncbi:MAG: hypothetical protein ABFD82_19115 [Syntrophaceae bacterium]